MKFAFLAGRVLFGGLFLFNGIDHFRNRRNLTQQAASKNVSHPDLAVIAAGLLLATGGASLLLGLKPKVGAAAIVTFLASVTPTMHDFWNLDDPGQRTNDAIHFMKNIGLLGAALALMAVEEPWPASIPTRESGFAGEARVTEYEFEYEEERVPVPAL